LLAPTDRSNKSRQVRGRFAGQNRRRDGRHQHRAVDEKMNNEGKLGMTIMQGKDHAESFLLVETGRASALREDDILIAGFRANAKNPGDFKLLDKSYPSDPYALMIRKDDQQFKALIDETLAKLMRSSPSAGWSTSSRAAAAIP
jgi:Bacterial extracellular solute-binding proteins, family 3